jgi:hypothetical protein
MPTLLDDARRRPELFCWFGAIPKTELQAWLEEHGLAIPADLQSLWCITGGGDVFESETILRPNAPAATTGFYEAGDDIETINASFRQAGCPEHFLVFHTGSFLSAVDLSGFRYVTLSESHAVISEYASLDDWYSQTLRQEFGSRYGLDAYTGDSRKG